MGFLPVRKEEGFMAGEGEITKKIMLPVPAAKGKDYKHGPAAFSRVQATLAVPFCQVCQGERR